MKTGTGVRSAARNAEGKVALGMVGAVLMAATLAQRSKSVGRSLMQRTAAKAR